MDLWAHEQTTLATHLQASRLLFARPVPQTHMNYVAPQAASSGRCSCCCERLHLQQRRPHAQALLALLQELQEKTQQSLSRSQTPGHVSSLLLWTSLSKQLQMQQGPQHVAVSANLGNVSLLNIQMLTRSSLLNWKRSTYRDVMQVCDQSCYSRSDCLLSSGGPALSGVPAADALPPSDPPGSLFSSAASSSSSSSSESLASKMALNRSMGFC